jgi:hypothetical protein
MDVLSMLQMMLEVSYRSYCIVFDDPAGPVHLLEICVSLDSRFWSLCSERTNCIFSIFHLQRASLHFSETVEDIDQVKYLKRHWINNGNLQTCSVVRKHTQLLVE